MIDITDTKRQNKEALRYILNYYDLKKSYREALQSVSLLGATRTDDTPHGTGMGNPTMQKAFKLLDIDKQHQWILAVETMENTLNVKERKFLELRRQAEINSLYHHTQGRPGWVGYVQYHYTDWLYNTYGIDYTPSRRTMILWVNDMVEKTVRIAINNGCFK